MEFYCLVAEKEKRRNGDSIGNNTNKDIAHVHATDFPLVRC